MVFKYLSASNVVMLLLPFPFSTKHRELDSEQEREPGNLKSQHQKLVTVASTEITTEILLVLL